MKTLIYFFMIIILFTGCKKKNDTPGGSGMGGKLSVNMTYKVTITNKGTSKAYASEIKGGQYSQFGNYITSITPSIFIGKFLDMRLMSPGTDLPTSFGFNIIDNNTPPSSPSRLADFSHNGSVDFTPNVPLFSSDIVLSHFIFMPMFYYQEFELPAQYDGIAHLQFLTYGTDTINLANDIMGGKRIGRVIKGSHQPFMSAIFDPQWSGNGNFPPIPSNYVFGGTDSTFMVYGNGQFNKDNPLLQTGYIIRGNSFTGLTLHPVPEGETKTVKGTMSFNLDNLIQIYAGKDNIPYTSDDIFVYSPKFWERLTISLSAE